MTEVPTQTEIQPQPTVSSPGPSSTPSAAGTPSAGPTQQTTQPTGASTETRPGAGLEVTDLKDLTVHSLEAGLEDGSIQFIDDDGDADPTIPAVPVAPAVVESPGGTAPAPAPAKVEDVLELPGQIPRKMRFPINGDEVRFHTLQAMRKADEAGQPISFAEAERIAHMELGRPAPVVKVVEDPGSAPAPAGSQPSGTTAPPPAAVDPNSLAGRLEAAYATFKEARERLDESGEADALRLINQLHEEKTVAAVREATERAAREQQEAAEHQTEFNRQWQASVESARSMWPDAADPVSALAVRAAELQEQYGTSTDPAQRAIYESASSPVFFYQQAAAELGLTPAARPAPAPNPSPSVTSKPAPGHTQRPPASVLLASPPGTQSRANPQFDPLSITNIHDLERIVESMEV